MEEIIDYKGYRIRIEQDDNYESPDMWGDNELFLVYDHRQFTVKRKDFEPQDIYENGLAYEKNYWIFPVEAYIHSGVHLSLFNGTKQCRWDSSVSGYILASKEEFEGLETAKIVAEGLIETWNQYLSGDVWGFIIEKPNEYYTISKKKISSILTADDYNNDMIPLDSFIKTSNLDHDYEEIDSCWGFYGQEECIEEAKSIIDSYE